MGPAALAAEIHGVRVLTSWRAEALPADGLAEVSADEDTLGFWLWSQNAAPRRLPPEEPLPISLEPTQDTLDARIGDGEQELPEELELLAAPVAMWQEVPESLIPAWPVPENGVLKLPRLSGEAWRLRLVGNGAGGAWIEVPAARERLALRPPGPASDRDLTILGPSAEPVADVALRFYGSGQGDAPDMLAGYLSDSEGKVWLPALPAELETELLIVEEDLAPWRFAGRLSSLPETLRLAAGSVLRGRVVDSDGRPISGARVHAMVFSAPGSTRVFARRGESGENGAWRLAGLASGKLRLAITAPGFAQLDRLIELEGGTEEDLGSITLEPARNVELYVTDTDKRPVAEAEITTENGRRVFTDSEGFAQLGGLPRNPAQEVEVDAPGFLSTTVRLGPPRKEPLEVELTAALLAVGRFLDHDGVPVAGGQATLEIGDQTTFFEILGDGSFEIEVPPATRAGLLLSSERTAELRLTLAPGERGEVRDLGDLRAPLSFEITGRLLSSEEAAPIEGARVWALRSADDPLFAWIRGDILQTQSDAEGRFILEGTTAPSTLVRIDAPGRARRHLEVVVPEGETHYDAGEIELHRGSEVIVRVDEEDTRGLEARLDLRGAWLESDMLTATVVGERARFANVPAGPAILSLERGHEVICDQEIDVPDEGEILEVECGVGRSIVRGLVLAGEVPAGAGQLTWRPGGDRAPAVIMRHRVGQLETAEVYSGGRPDVVVPVDASGYFETRALRAGDWEVVWSSEAASSLASPMAVRLEETKEQEITLRLPFRALVGTVVDSEGRGVEGARVRELDQGAFALSGADGSFRLEGLEPGRLRVRARQRESSSEVVSVVLEPDVPPPALRLELADRQARAHVQVVDENGLPAAGALVFVEVPGGGLRLLTADSEGRLEMPFHPPHPDRLRAAAYRSGHWIFGPWIDFETAREDWVLRGGATGGIEITCEESCGILRLGSVEGWDLAAMSLRLGRRLFLSPGEPLVLSGLPEGSYLASLDGVERRFAIEAGELESLELP